MRHSILILLLLGYNLAFSQGGSIRIVINKYDSLNSDEPIFVQLSQKNSVVSELYLSYDKPFTFDNLAPGVYKIAINRFDRRTEYYDSLTIIEGETFNLQIKFPGPCPYVYNKRQKPKCPYGHSDSIIPIRYGLPDQRLMELADEGKVYLGGCIRTSCDPQFYCKKHKVEL